MRYYNIELARPEADLLKAFLLDNKITFETSGAGALVHFEVLLDNDNYMSCSNFLDTL